MTPGTGKLVAVCATGLLFSFPKSSTLRDGVRRTNSAEVGKEHLKEEGTDGKRRALAINFAHFSRLLS